MSEASDTPTQAMLAMCDKYKQLLSEQLSRTDPDHPGDKFRRIGFSSALEELDAIYLLVVRLKMGKTSPAEMAELIIDLRENALENRTRYEGRMMVHDFVENAMAEIMLDFFGLAPTRGLYASPSAPPDDEDKIPFVW